MKSNLFQTASIIIGGGLGFFGYEVLRGNEKFYKSVLMPTLQTVFDPEQAHNLSVKLLSYGVPLMFNKFEHESLKTEVLGLKFENPVGIAAGFDKHAEAMCGLGQIGFGFVEVGSITPLPQDGNQKPRVFRLPEDNAVINRYGFNSCGHEVAKKRLKDFKSSKSDQKLVLGVNLGKNKTSNTPNKDYSSGVKTLGMYADYIVINVSSPNTPGLRNLQDKEKLLSLCSEVLSERDNLPERPPVLIKIAPDLSNEDKQDIASVAKELDIDGIIVSNTTISRDSSLLSVNKVEKGGLSGGPVKKMSTELIGEMYKLTQGTVPIIGVGGIANGEDAYEKIKNGASLVQLYTAFTYSGPPIVNSIKRDLVNLLKQDGFSRVSDAVGVNIRISKSNETSKD